MWLCITGRRKKQVRQSHNRKMDNGINNTGILISVVICTYNRSAYIEDALESLTSQTLARDQYEILIIDNMSTDATAGICQSFIDRHPGFDIRYYLEPNRGLSYARNRGISESTSPIICYMDDDAEAVPHYLSSLVEFFSAHPEAVGAGGRVVPKYPRGEEPVWMSRYLNGFIGKVDFGKEIKPFSGKMKFPAGCNMIYKKSILEKAGGFNTKLTFRSDDKFIFYQVLQISRLIYYVPDAKVIHNIDEKRLGISNFRTLFLKTGNEEKIRVLGEAGSIGYLKKLFEYLIKCLGSCVIYCQFLLKGQTQKGRYLVLSQWYTLSGFLKKEVFVR
ncbi:MAG: glycosyltransferase [Terrimonas sp.]|nr:glycosyltransferase [Terrimonas sp.]